MSAAIPIRNLFHLLCYAWDMLEMRELINVEAMEEHDTCNLLARVLAEGMRQQMRRGLELGYVLHEEEAARVRGHVDFTACINRQSLRRGVAVCRFDELDPDILPNRILRATLDALLQTQGLKPENAAKLRPLREVLRQVASPRLTSRDFHCVRIGSHQRLYRFLINLCELLQHLLLPEKATGNFRMRDFFQDEVRMRGLFERFAFNFYNRHVTDATKIRAYKIKWNAEFPDVNSQAFLPEMRTDVCIEWPDRKLILDCKFSTKGINTSYHNAEKLNSAHLYQLFAYLKNQSVETGWEQTTGVLLYPVVQRNFDFRYRFGTHPIRVATVDLNEPWQAIELRMMDVIAG